MTCSHSSIAVGNGFLQCVDCKAVFRNGELGVIRKQREEACNHSDLEDGWYASNPPKKKCLGCGKFFLEENLPNK